VIIDHGEGHYTVSANLGEIDVRVGDDVSTGTRLGVVGSSGQGWLVYFEIRIGAETADPAEWFGI
jgi:septal ring factor EnvC (AmiA/AmiB activator)